MTLIRHGLEGCIHRNSPDVDPYRNFRFGLQTLSPATSRLTIVEPSTPPSTSSGGHEADLPKPPIWDRSQQSSVPPIDIPQAAPGARRPVIPDVPQASPGAGRPVIPDVPQAAPQGAAAQDITSPAPSSAPGAGARPQWPAQPPVAGEPTPTSLLPGTNLGAAPPAPEAPTKTKSRIAMFAVALAAMAALVGGAFFFGRSFGSDETVTTPIVAPVVETPTTAPEPTVPPTQVPAPTPVPSPPVNDAPSPVLPGEGADEPVAAVARAVAPAVVLIQTETGQGSGIIYDDAGLILTNAHVVGQSTAVRVTLASGASVEGVVIGADPLTDVAVVRIDTDFEFGVAELAPESSVEVGQLAVAIGSPFGLEQTVTSGIVSAKGRVVENFTDDGRLSFVAMIQTDAPINPGNSGGALADRQGRVIGMNTSIRTDGSGGNIGVGFAVPADTAKLIADRIIAGEPLDQGFLGINGATPTIGEPGVVVGLVTEGSGAAAAGIQIGDLIVGFNDGAIKSMSDLAAAVRLQPPNAVVSVDLIRDGEPLTLQVTLGLLQDE